MPEELSGPRGCVGADCGVRRRGLVGVEGGIFDED